jgi:hypothetical protein
MALKIRQGLEALRTSFVPESGELIYTTDDKLVYVGDGITPGGNIISSGAVADGNTTYSISAETAVSGANLRLTGSDASTDNVNFVGTGIITVSRTDGNTITIDAVSGGGGSGTVNAGLTGTIAFYAADGTTVDGTGTDFTYDINTQIVDIAILDVDRIQSSSPIFRIINTSNDIITLGGIIDTTEYSGKFAATDIGPYDPNFPVTSSFRQVHNDANVNCLVFQRERGTLTTPLGIQQGDVIGAMLWVADTDGNGDIARLATMGVAASDTFTPGSGIVPGTWFVQTTNALGGTFTALYVDGAHDTHSVYYHYARLGIYTPQIDTEDSSALTIVPPTVFNADVEIQNDLYVTNKVFANEFVSSSTGTPQIVTAQDLSLIAGTTTVTISSSSPTIEVPENINTTGDLNFNVNTTVLTISGSSDSMTVPSTLDTATATTDLILGGTNAQLTVGKSSSGYINFQTANGTYAWEMTADGGLALPLRSSAPGSPTAGAIYLADNANWDPLNLPGSVPYCVIWSGAAWVPINGV